MISVLYIAKVLRPLIVRHNTVYKEPTLDSVSVTLNVGKDFVYRELASDDVSFMIETYQSSLNFACAAMAVRPYLNATSHIAMSIIYIILYNVPFSIVVIPSLVMMLVKE